MNKNCPPGKIINPKTNRCVLIDGKIGQKLLMEANVYSKDAKKIADKINQLIKNKALDVTININVNYELNNKFYKEICKNLGESAKKLKTTLSEMDYTERVLFSFKSLYIVLVHFSDTPNHNYNEFRIVIFNNKKTAKDFLEMDEVDDY